MYGETELGGHFPVAKLADKLGIQTYHLMDIFKKVRQKFHTDSAALAKMLSDTVMDRT